MSMFHDDHLQENKSYIFHILSLKSNKVYNHIQDNIQSTKKQKDSKATEDKAKKEQEAIDKGLKKVIRHLIQRISLQKFEKIAQDIISEGVNKIKESEGSDDSDGSYVYNPDDEYGDQEQPKKEKRKSSKSSKRFSSIQRMVLQNLTLENKVEQHSFHLMNKSTKSSVHSSLVKIENGFVMTVSEEGNYCFSNDEIIQNSGEVSCLCFVDNQIYSSNIFEGKSAFLDLINTKSMHVEKQLQVPQGFTKMMIVDDYIVCAGQDGLICLISRSEHKIVANQKHPSRALITDFVATEKDNEICIALKDFGLSFATFNLKEFNITFCEDVYAQGSKLQCLALVKPNTYLLCSSGSDHIDLLDINANKVTNISYQHRDPQSKRFNCLMAVDGYDYEAFPYMLLKDSDKIVLINVNTTKITKIIDSNLDAVFKSSLINFRNDKNLKIMSLDYDPKKKVRTIQELSFFGIYKD